MQNILDLKGTSRSSLVSKWKFQFREDPQILMTTLWEKQKFKLRFEKTIIYLHYSISGGFRCLEELTTGQWRQCDGQLSILKHSDSPWEIYEKNI